MNTEDRLKIRKMVLKKDVEGLKFLSKDILIEYIQDTNAITVQAMHQLVTQI